MDGRQWRELLAPTQPWETQADKDIRIALRMSELEGLVREVLSGLEYGVTVTPTQLGYHLWPREEREPGEDMKSFFTALRQLGDKRMKAWRTEEFVQGGPTGQKKVYSWFNPNVEDW